MKNTKNMKGYIFIFLFCVYFLFTDGIATVNDEAQMMNMSITLVHSGTPAYTIPGTTKLAFLRFSFLQPLLGVPLAVIGRLSGCVFGIADDYWQSFIIMLFNPIITASTAVLLYVSILCLFNDRKSALLVSLAFGLGTLSFPYTATFFSEPLIGLFLFGSITFSILSSKENDNDKNMILISGIFFGMTVLLKFIHIIMVGIFMLYFFISNKEKSFKHIMGLLCLWFTPVIISVFIYFLYNYYRYRDILNFGYPRMYPSLQQDGIKYYLQSFTTPLWYGLVGNLFSPGKSFFYFSPIAIVGVIGFRKFYKSYKEEGIFIGLVILFYFYIYSTWSVWEGGLCWGPRLLLPLLPLFLLLSTPLFIQAKGKYKTTLYLLIAISISVQVISSLKDIVPLMGMRKIYYGTGSEYRLGFNPWQILFKDVSSSTPLTIAGILYPHLPAVKELRVLLFYPKYIDIWWIKLVAFRYKTGYVVVVVLTALFIMVLSGLKLIKWGRCDRK